MKATSSISGPYDDVELPRGEGKGDWEIELGIVIGKPAKYTTVAEAPSHIAGYCVINDLSAREAQLEGTGQWVKGKSADTFAPIGPWLVTPDEIGDPQKPEFLNGAAGLIFPIQWPEPFGLVMIEAMACGTPVIGYNCGSVPEVIDDFRSGFVVKDVDSAAAAVGRLSQFANFGDQLQAIRSGNLANRLVQPLLQTANGLLELVVGFG